MKNKELEKIFKDASEITDDDIQDLFLKKQLSGKDITDSDIDDIEATIDNELNELKKEIEQIEKTGKII